jgi:hypothetical protein
MAALVAAILVLKAVARKSVDGRDEPGPLAALALRLL